MSFRISLIFRGVGLVSLLYKNKMFILLCSYLFVYINRKMCSQDVFFSFFYYYKLGPLENKTSTNMRLQFSIYHLRYHRSFRSKKVKLVTLSSVEVTHVEKCFVIHTCLCLFSELGVVHVLKRRLIQKAVSDAGIVRLVATETHQHQTPGGLRS